MKNDNLSETAQAYTQKGFSVIPVAGKKPTIQWKEFQQRIPTKDEITNLFSNPSVTGIAIVTGLVSNLVVLDFEEGADIGKYELPRTLTAKTGGGGWHYYYRMPAHIKIANATRLNGELLDIRGEGGYVVAPPSVHPSGNRYEWIPENCEIADLPQWVITAMNRGNSSEVRQINSKDWSEIVTGVSEGKRHSTAVSLVGKLMSNKISENDLESLVWPTFLLWNESNNPPLDEDELRSIFDGIAKKESEKTPPDKGSITLSELLEMECPENPFIVEGLVPEEGVTFISGDGGTFKSSIAMYIARQVMSEEKVFGKFSTKKTNILYIDEDNGKVGMHGIANRLFSDGDLPIRFRIGTGVKIENKWIDRLIAEARKFGIGLIIIDSFFRMNDGDENSAREIAAKMDMLKRVKDSGISIIVIHHNRKSNNGFPSNPGQDMRGSSVLRDSLDSHISISKGTAGILKINQTKNRYGAQTPAFNLRIVQQDPLVFEYLAESKEDRRQQLETAIIDLITVNGSCDKQTIMSACSGIVSKHSVTKALKELVATQQIIETSGRSNKSMFSIPESLDV